MNAEHTEQAGGLGSRMLESPQSSSRMEAEDPRRLTNLMRRVWKTHRLDVIREEIERIISLLEILDVEFNPGTQPQRAEMALVDDSVPEALRTCCDELREGCGLVNTTAQRERLLLGRLGKPAWAQAYGAALTTYRDAAYDALEASMTRVFTASVSGPVDSTPAVRSVARSSRRSAWQPARGR